MRIIKAKTLLNPIVDMILKANYVLPDKILQKIKQSFKTETNPIGISILGDILKNADIAKNEKVPLCQDTGFALFFIKKGNELFIEGDLEEIITEAVKIAYVEGYLRKSILSDPLHGINTQDNTPAIFWYESTPGDKLEILFAPKGGGAENMSRVKMLKPADGVEGIKDFVLETVKIAGGNPCPPIILGVGIGGTFEKCAWLAKKAVLRDLDNPNKDSYYENLEKELLLKINETDIGPGGLGGKITALGVNIEVFPRHIATLPVAVNVQCHSARHSKIIV